MEELAVHSYSGLGFQLLVAAACRRDIGHPVRAHWHLSSLSEGLPSRGRPWRDSGPQSACTSVVSVSLLLVALSRKLARGGLTFTPCAVTEPSIAFRSWKGKSQVSVLC